MVLNTTIGRSVLLACGGLAMVAAASLGMRALESIEQLEVPNTQAFIDGLASYPHGPAFGLRMVDVPADETVLVSLPAEAGLLGPESLAN